MIIEAKSTGNYGARHEETSRSGARCDLLFGQSNQPNCGRVGPSLMAAMTLVVAADRGSALTRLTLFHVTPAYDGLVRNGPGQTALSHRHEWTVSLAYGPWMTIGMLESGWAGCGAVVRPERGRRGGGSSPRTPAAR